MLKEFQTFAMRGNVVDLAVGLVLGAAFGKIVTSLVNDIVMPPIGLLLGQVDFSSLFINLTGQPYDSLKQAQDAGAPTMNIGVFINTIIDFVVIAFAIFIVIRQINRLVRKPQPAAPAAPMTKACPHCYTDIPIKATRCPHCTSQLAAA